MADNEAQRLSRLLWDARERVEMSVDLVEEIGRPDTQGRALVAEIDAYRAERGWSPNGFGGEEDDEHMFGVRVRGSGYVSDSRFDSAQEAKDFMEWALTNPSDWEIVRRRRVGDWEVL